MKGKWNVPLESSASWQGTMDQARRFVGPFGGADKMAVILFLSTTALVLVYFYS